MEGSSRRRARLVEGAKLLSLLVVFYAIHVELVGLRQDLRCGGSGVARAETRQKTDLGAARVELEAARREMQDVRSDMEGTRQRLEECAGDLWRNRSELEESLEQLTTEREELRDLLLARTLELEGSVLGRLDAERTELSETRSSLRTQQTRLEKLSNLLERDSKLMKKKMILPTTQLRGNGTVGSGVIVYSEPQPDVDGTEGSPVTTFILTAHHVVREVLGDDIDVSAVIHRVHVLLDREPDTTQRFSAKVVLFDREKDVALLRLNSTRKFRNVADLMPSSEFREIDIFARAYAVGCPLGNRPLPTLGEISTKSKVVGRQRFWMLSAPTFFGNSGGGIYLAENCKLIGISSMIYTYGKANPTVVPHMGLFVPMDVIYRWLDTEGFRFIIQRKPIPTEMLWKLVYLDRSASIPRAVSGTSSGNP